MTGPMPRPKVYSVSGRSETVRETPNSWEMAPVAGTVEDVAIVLISVTTTQGGVSGMRLALTFGRTIGKGPLRGKVSWRGTSFGGSSYHPSHRTDRPAHSSHRRRYERRSRHQPFVAAQKHSWTWLHSTLAYFLVETGIVAVLLYASWERRDWV